MKVVDYLKVSFKKPELSESIAQIIEKKNRITTQLEFCYSRLESIELCNSSSKPNDALLLSNFLIIDIMNLALFYSGKSIITANEKWEEKISSLSEPDLISAFTNHKTVKDTTYKSEEEQSEEIESSLSNLLQSVEKFIFNKNKSQFENPVDDYDKKIKFQLLVGIIVSAFLIHSSVPLIVSKLVSGRHNQEGGTLVYALWSLKKQSFKDDLIALKKEDISYEMQLMLDMMEL